MGYSMELYYMALPQKSVFNSQTFAMYVYTFYYQNVHKIKMVICTTKSHNNVLYTIQDKA